MPFERTVIFGGSRGLGLCLVEEMESDPSKVLMLSRKPPKQSGFCTHKVQDLSRPDQFEESLKLIQEFQPDRAIYCAGGGPYGKFETSNWKSHQWAIQVTFLSAAWWLHELLGFTSLQQFVLIGSSVAEASPDPMAASYCAAKHALKGLHSTLVVEDGPADIRLYSPGYMDTDLLPKGSWPRQQKRPLWDPVFVAKDLLQWSEDESQRRGHKILGPWGDDA